MPMTANNMMAKIGYGADHSLTIGATIVTDLAIMPHDATWVFLFSAGKILSSVKETWVVVMKEWIIPILSINIKQGMNFSSN